jgi:hypothetical protein
MTLETLIEYIKQGREIEFRLGKRNYFHSFDGEKYTLYDELSKEFVFEGDLKDELKFEFQENISFGKSINLFRFDYIL